MCVFTAQKKPLAANATLHARDLIARPPPVYHQQDLGNTNYCVFVPRTEFDRKTNAELVVRGLQKLDLAAYVNERNDICVDGFKMSSPSTFFTPASGKCPFTAARSSLETREPDEFLRCCCWWA